MLRYYRSLKSKVRYIHVCMLLDLQQMRQCRPLVARLHTTISKGSVLQDFSSDLPCNLNITLLLLRCRSRTSAPEFKTSPLRVLFRDFEICLEGEFEAVRWSLHGHGGASTSTCLKLIRSQGGQFEAWRWLTRFALPRCHPEAARYLQRAGVWFVRLLTGYCLPALSTRYCHTQRGGCRCSSTCKLTVLESSRHAAFVSDESRL